MAREAQRPTVLRATEELEEDRVKSRDKAQFSPLASMLDSCPEHI